MEHPEYGIFEEISNKELERAATCQEKIEKLHTVQVAYAIGLGLDVLTCLAFRPNNS